jgi:glutathione S-transferase
MLELYHHGSSVCAAKVRLVLEEKGLAWTGHYVDILRGEQHDPAYVKLNPKRCVPTLVHDGEVVRESTLIAEYLDEVFPDPPLRPADALGRARMRLWTKAIDEEWGIGTITFVCSHRYTLMKLPKDEVEAMINQKPDPFARARKRSWVEDGFDCPDLVKEVLTADKLIARMEEALAAGGPWLMGDAYTLADVAWTPWINRLDMLAMSEMWTEARPHVTAWFDRVKARPNFAPAIFKYLPDELAEDLRANGRKSWPRIKEILDAAGDGTPSGRQAAE